MFERPKTGECAILVHVEFPATDAKEDLAEFQQLTLSAGAAIAATVIARRRTPEAKLFIGTGKAEEIAILVSLHQADIVLFNHALTPAQERNLEKVLKCRVMDRTSLILDIFAQRARTHEGKLQVELAQLKHLSTRLVRGWTHLERQKGGIGLRGPGETQLESDRRLVRMRMASILRQLEKVKSQRQESRKARQRADILSISLVGYTNAGKSTLFNALTDATVYAADKLFATLDPTFRKVALPQLGPVILVDTVGFIRHLPHDLIAAFRATLEETINADLLLHVVDLSNPDWRETVTRVDEVLKEIGADNVPQLKVYNKIDLLQAMQPRLQKGEAGDYDAAWLSAGTGQGLDLLRQAISKRLFTHVIEKQLLLPHAEGKLRAEFYALGAVLKESTEENGTRLLSIRLPVSDYERLKKHFPQIENFLT